jgi:hypothetical protein
MKSRLRYALAVAFLVAITAVAASALVFTGNDENASKTSESPNARTPVALAEQIRADRRDSLLRHRQCSKHMRQATPDV